MNQLIFDTVWTIVSLILFFGTGAGIVYLIHKLCRRFHGSSEK